MKIPLPPWFGKFAQAISIALAVTAFSVSPQLSLAQSGNLTVVEFVSKTTGIYFITGRPSEQALLDSYPTLWERTGMQFQTFAGDRAVAQDVICRYQIRPTGTVFSTHFYGGTSDCALVASQNRPDLYIYEELDFGIYQPTASGSCPAQAPVAIYRSYRFASPVNVPNHRYSVNQAAYNEMTTRGYTPEGPVFCVISATPANPLPTFAASSLNKDRCVAPRVGSSPYTGRAYPDQPGALSNELNWMRSWIDETYLWYREVPNVNQLAYSSPQTLFPVLKTPYKTFINIDKDQFHFNQSTDAAEQSRSGSSSGYGIRWEVFSTTAPRRFVASVVTPGSPAANAGVARGDEIVSIDGADFVNGNNVAALNAGLSPATTGEAHNFVFRTPVGATKSVTLVSATVASRPVSDVGVITTPTGRVGYIAFHSFGSNVAESQLVSAFSSLATQGLSDLVLDLRYNGGGFIDISAQLGYMIAGPARSAGKTYEVLRTNEKKPFGPDDITPFHSQTLGFSLTSGQPLPTLNLGRVFILTSDNTCSASESLINGLRGIDVDVKLVGNTTCGKPYGFFATDNCGTTYYSIQFDGVNAKGVGDYIAGFNANCAASDDLTKPFGDPTEKQLAAALSLRSTGVCAPQSSAQKAAAKRVVAAGTEGAVRNPNAEQFEANNRLARIPKPLIGVADSVEPTTVRMLGAEK